MAKIGADSALGDIENHCSFSDPQKVGKTVLFSQVRNIVFLVFIIFFMSLFIIGWMEMFRMVQQNNKSIGT